MSEIKILADFNKLLYSLNTEFGNEDIINDIMILREKYTKKDD